MVNLTRNQWSHSAGIRWSISAVYPATFQTEIDNKSPINTEIKDSLNGIVINRHKIAHGQHVGIGYVTVKNYYSYCVTAVEILETVIN